MSLPRYFKAKHSHCFYTNTWQLYLFSNGFTVKHKNGSTKNNSNWRHVSFRIERRKPKYSAYKLGKIRIELSTHLSEGFNHTRIHKCKKYVRFIICC